MVLLVGSGKAEGDTRAAFVPLILLSVLSSARLLANNVCHAADGTWRLERLRTFYSNFRLKTYPCYISQVTCLEAHPWCRMNSTWPTRFSSSALNTWEVSAGLPDKDFRSCSGNEPCVPSFASICHSPPAYAASSPSMRSCMMPPPINERERRLTQTNPQAMWRRAPRALLYGSSKPLVKQTRKYTVCKRMQTKTLSDDYPMSPNHGEYDTQECAASRSSQVKHL